MENAKLERLRKRYSSAHGGPGGPKGMGFGPGPGGPRGRHQAKLAKKLAAME